MLSGNFGTEQKYLAPPPQQKPERGYVHMFLRNENRNEGTFAKTTLLRNRPFISQWQKSPRSCLLRISYSFKERVMRQRGTAELCPNLSATPIV